MWPEFVQLVQAALNTHARGDQSEIECMLDIHRMYQAAVEQGSEPNWKRFQTAASFSLAPCSSYMGAVVAYVRANSGGTDGTRLEELSRHHKAFACNAESGPARSMGSEFLYKLTSLNFGPGNRFPYVLNACIKANLSSPSDKVVDGVCRLILPSHVAHLASKKVLDKVREAEALMTESRSLLSAARLDESQQTTLIGKLDVRLVLFLTGRGKEGEGRTFTSIGEIGQVHVCVWCLG